VEGRPCSGCAGSFVQAPDLLSPAETAPSLIDALLMGIAA
jgi:hypothetical protein